MPTGIFLLQQNGDLTEMSEQEYQSEDLLQGLLEKYPNLLAGDQMDETEPRRWLLVRREISVPDEEFSGGRWSVDHLFLDQDGIPTLIEVKRSADTRIRREVVGQMLDYAANAVAYWSLEKIQAEFEKQFETSETDPKSALAAFLGPSGDPEEFWQKVKTNLQAGKLRLVFVADVIPPELRRIIEFLNGQMDPAEVLAVEIRKFQGDGQMALVPRVLGNTSAAQQKKKVSSQKRSTPWDRDSFLAKLSASSHPEDAPIAEEIFRWMEDQGLEQEGGWGAGYASIYFRLNVDHSMKKPFNLYEGDRRAIFHLYLNELGNKFQDTSVRKVLFEKMNATGFNADESRQYPGLAFSDLRSEENRLRFFNLLNWVKSRINTPVGDSD